MFRAEDERHLLLTRMKCRDAAMRAVRCRMEHANFSRANVNHLDSLPIEDISRCIRANVIDDPFAIRRPDPGLREDVPVRGASDLLLAPERFLHVISNRKHGGRVFRLTSAGHQHQGERCDGEGSVHQACAERAGALPVQDQRPAGRVALGGAWPMAGFTGTGLPCGAVETATGEVKY